MAVKQNIFRVRRSYNQWVANQTLEDYALRFTAKSARRWSAARVSHTALGAISFLAMEAIGGSITLHYGFDNWSIVANPDPKAIPCAAPSSAAMFASSASRVGFCVRAYS